MMRTIVCVALMLALLPAAARSQTAQGPQEEALKRLLEDQARRMEVLERRLATLETELETLRALGRGTPPNPTTTVPQEVVPNEPADEEALPPPFPDEHAVDGQPPYDPNPAAPAGDLPRALVVDFYGSLRGVFLVNENGFSQIRNGFSRLGLRGEKLFAPGVNVFARYEAGINIVDNDPILLNGDPGTPIGQGGLPLYTRLGFVGVQAGFGQVSWGRQWSAYYDVAEFTDQFQLFGAAASGAYAAGTDGGIVGTARSERTLLYRKTIGWFSGAAQMQMRATSPNDRRLADTWGASIILGKPVGFGVGVGFNQVRDGVVNPNPNQAQLGDEAAIVGGRWRNDDWYVGTTYSILTHHEIDDLRRRFSGNGFELALRRTFGRRFWIEGGFNDLSPNSDHEGDFRVRTWLSDVVYQFGVASRLYIGGLINDSRNSDNRRPQSSAFYTGLNYTF